MPLVVHATLVRGTGSYTSITGTVMALTWDPAQQLWVGQVNTSIGLLAATLACRFGRWGFNTGAASVTNWGTPTTGSYTCPPNLDIPEPFTAATGPGADVGTIQWTITA